jgi:RNA polymerase sigma-70 factor (ECF subfamily)
MERTATKPSIESEIESAQPGGGAPPELDEIYRQHHQRIVRLCRMMLGDADEGDEAAQEVFVRMLAQRRGGVEPAQWGAWLTRVAINACHDRRRSGWWKWWRRDGRELVDSDLTTHRDAEEEAITHEQGAAIWRGFSALSPRQREVFVLRQIEGWPTREVGAALNLTDQAVKLHLFRAVRRLREILRSER